MLSVAVIFLFLIACFNPQQGVPAAAPVHWSLKFENYPAGPILKGKPARAGVTRTELFRTRISQGAKKGPNFAGHYTVVEWGCGSGCIAFVIVDAVSGRVHDPPINIVTVPFLGTINGREYQGVAYQLNSNLLIADGCPGEDGEDQADKCGTYYYQWNNKRFKQVRFDSEKPAKTLRPR